MTRLAAAAIAATLSSVACAEPGAGPSTVVVAPTGASGAEPVAAGPAPEEPPLAKRAPLVPVTAAAFRAALLDEIGADPSPEAALLRGGNDAERRGDPTDARKKYFDLISRSPSSPLVPYAYLAFADMFFAEAEENDPTKWPIASTAYQRVVGYPPPGNRALAYAWHRPASCSRAAATTRACSTRNARR